MEFYKRIMKNRTWMIIAVSFIMIVIIPASFLAAQNKSVPDDPLKDQDNGRSQVLISGKDFDIDKDQLEKHEEEQKEYKKIKEHEKKEKGQSQKERLTGESGNDATTSDSGFDPVPENSNNSDQEEEQQNPGEDTESDSKLPKIVTNLTDGKTYGGTYKTIEITATDYKGRVITRENLYVSGNGEKLTSTSNNGRTFKYRFDLADGGNKVYIKATDRYGNSAEKSYTIYGDPNGKVDKIGKAKFSVDAKVLNLGYLIGPITIDLYEGEQLSYITDRILHEYGYEYRMPGSSSLKNGFYLAYIEKKNITKGWNIDKALMKKLESEDVEINGNIDDNSLGERDFTGGSGWMYEVDGDYKDSGISTYIPNDGDVIKIRFTLYYGYDIGFALMGGETWGNW